MARFAAHARGAGAYRAVVKPLVILPDYRMNRSS